MGRAENLKTLHDVKRRAIPAPCAGRQRKIVHYGVADFPCNFVFIGDPCGQEAIRFYALRPEVYPRTRSILKLICRCEKHLLGNIDDPHNFAVTDFDKMYQSLNSYEEFLVWEVMVS
jgi:hypothetical protein